nr:hypothetical protein [uncultured Capnocytophaga sp.]
MNIVEIENIVKDFLDLTFIGFCFELPIHIENDFYIIGLDYEDKVGISCKNNLLIAYYFLMKLSVLRKSIVMYCDLKK